MAISTLFKVVSISKNTNSFGLYGVIIVDKSGLAFEIAVSQLNLPSQGNYVTGQITENGNLHSMPFGYEIPRKLPNLPKKEAKELFRDVARKQGLSNAAAGKKIKNTLDFARVFGKLNVDNKALVIKNIERTLKEGISPLGTAIKDTERAATEQLLKWCTVNLLVGDELCPPENLNQY